MKLSFTKHDFKDVVSLFAGSASAQLIVFAATPILTRIYSAHDMGVFFTFTSWVMLLATVGTLQYELTIIMATQHRYAAQMLYWSLGILLSFCVVLLVFAFTIQQGYWSPEWFSVEERNLWWLPVALFGTGLQQITMYWNNRLGQFGRNAAGRLTKSLLMVGLQIAACCSFFSVLGLVGAYAVSCFVAGMVQLFMAKSVLSFRPRYLQWRVLIKQYRQVPFFNTGATLLNLLSNHLPLLVLPIMYGFAEGALYGMALRLIATPSGLVSEAWAQPLFKQMAGLKAQNQSVQPLVKQNYRTLFRLSVIPFAVIAVFAPWLFGWLLGSNWYSAGQIAQILALWLFLGFLNTPISYLATVMGKQKQFFIYNFLLLTARAMVFVLAYQYGFDLFNTVICFAAVGVIFNLYFYYFLNRIAANRVCS